MDFLETNLTRPLKLYIEAQTTFLIRSSALWQTLKLWIWMF